jgi:hypothetical protein
MPTPSKHKHPTVGPAYGDGDGSEEPSIKKVKRTFKKPSFEPAHSDGEDCDESPTKKIKPTPKKATKKKQDTTEGSGEMKTLPSPK